MVGCRAVVVVVLARAVVGCRAVVVAVVRVVVVVARAVIGCRAVRKNNRDSVHM